MAYQGMDPDEVSALGNRIHGEASNLQSIVTKLDGLVQSMQTNWDGADSVRFNHEYTGQYRPQITQAIEQLNQLSQVAIQNANEQRQTAS